MLSHLTLRIAGMHGAICDPTLYIILARCDLMSGQGYAFLTLREILGKKHASPFFHSVPGWDVAACLRIKDKSVVNEGDWERT